MAEKTQEKAQKILVMSFEEVTEALVKNCEAMLEDLKGRKSKAAYKRVRALTLDGARLGKRYRELSTEED